MTIREKAILVLKVAASAPVHTAVDFIERDLGFSKTLAKRESKIHYLVMRSVSYVVVNKMPDYVSPDWWRDTLAEAAAVLEDGLV